MKDRPPAPASDRLTCAMLTLNWDKTARFYDRQLFLERRALRELATLATAQRGESVLDLATGTGAVLCELTRLYPSMRLAVGIDISAIMLARVSRASARCRLVRADARALPFESRSFDVITAAYLLHLLSATERSEVIAEVVRVLRPRGKFVVVTPHAGGSLSARALYAPVVFFTRHSRGVLSGLQPLDPRPELEEAGLSLTAERFVAWGYPSLCVAGTLH